MKSGIFVDSIYCLDLHNPNIPANPHDAVLGLYMAATNHAGGAASLEQQNRTKRVRTSFKNHQLRVLKQYFQLNHNPDAKELKQLSQKTGLSKRVLQVITLPFNHEQQSSSLYIRRVSCICQNLLLIRNLKFVDAMAMSFWFSTETCFIEVFYQKFDRETPHCTFYIAKVNLFTNRSSWSPKPVALFGEIKSCFKRVNYENSW